MWGLPWAVIELMTIDMPRYKYNSKGSVPAEPASKPLNADTAKEFMDKLKGRL